MLLRSTLHIGSPVFKHTCPKTVGADKSQYLGGGLFPLFRVFYCIFLFHAILINPHTKKQELFPRASGTSAFHQGNAKQSAPWVSPKVSIYVSPFICVHLRCSLWGNGDELGFIIRKGLTLKTGCTRSSAASAPPPSRRIPVHYALHHGGSSRFYKYLPVVLSSARILLLRKARQK